MVLLSGKHEKKNSGKQNPFADYTFLQNIQLTVWQTLKKLQPRRRKQTIPFSSSMEGLNVFPDPLQIWIQLTRQFSFKDLFADQGMHAICQRLINDNQEEAHKHIGIGAFDW